MTNATASVEDLLSEAIQCLAARDMARAGVTQQAIAKYLKKSKSDIGPMVQGIKKEKEEI